MKRGTKLEKLTGRRRILCHQAAAIEMILSAAASRFSELFPVRQVTAGGFFPFFKNYVQLVLFRSQSDRLAFFWWVAPLSSPSPPE